MTKNLIYLVVLAIALLGVSASSALASDTGLVSVERVAPWSSSTQVQISKNVCGGSNQINFSTSSSTHDRNFKIAMAALLSGKKVNINYSCSGSTANGSSVRIFP